MQEPVEKGVDVNKMKFGCTPLQRAAAMDRGENLLWLIDNKAEVNIQTERSKCTALMFAAANGHDAIVTLLLGAGADPNLKDSPFNYNALKKAQMFKKESCIPILKPVTTLEDYNTMYDKK
eukprot:FR734993.1.p1 GENE.FR734993.1~~FR734993.1.p1  ORF type:complete len:130 (+),score=33.50 FR734993.1:28-390(+)